jgi:hypothetical protein
MSSPTKSALSWTRIAELSPGSPCHTTVAVSARDGLLVVPFQSKPLSQRNFGAPGETLRVVISTKMKRVGERRARRPDLWRLDPTSTESPLVAATDTS